MKNTTELIAVFVFFKCLGAIVHQFLQIALCDVVENVTVTSTSMSAN